MVVVTFVIVVLRYVFGTGLIWMQESLVWMHAMVFMLGAAYTLGEDGHVRVDVFYREMSATRRAWVDLLGVLFFIWPVCGLLFFESFDYVADSWVGAEVSRNAGGLPYPAVPLLKSALLLMPLTVALQGLAMFSGSVQRLRRS
jgi:TRAP-type mannitol/chloroaromatic compound transport system permease small subunit